MILLGGYLRPVDSLLLGLLAKLVVVLVKELLPTGLALVLVIEIAILLGGHLSPVDSLLREVRRDAREDSAASRTTARHPKQSTLVKEQEMKKNNRRGLHVLVVSSSF